MDAAAELGRNPLSKHHIQPEYGDEQAGAGRDCRTRLARPNSQANAYREIFVFPVQLTTCRIGNLTPVDPYSCYMCDHTPYMLGRLDIISVFPTYEEVLYLQRGIPPKRFHIFPPDRGMLRRSRCAEIFL